MYAAKSAGGNGFALFKPHMHTAIAERVRVENGLRTAWLTGDLLVHYQPIVDLANGRMVSVEALARWKHPDGDVIPPDVFIPIAERTGLIIPIGARVLNEACQQLASWQREYGAAADITMSVNVSPRQLHSDDLVAIVAEAIRSAGHRPELPDPRGDRDRGHGRHGRCDPDPQPSQGARRRHGDRRFRCRGFVAGEVAPPPVAVVKIDKSLVDHVPDGHVASGLLDAVVGMVRALQLKTIIEGVERADQAKHLREAGYDLAQGFYYARPMDAAGIERSLASAEPRMVVAPCSRSMHGHATRSRIARPRDACWSSMTIDAVGVTACRILERHGLRAVLVPTIREAMAELSHSTDVMVVDIGMPDGDGWDLIGHVRASTCTPACRSW